MPAPLYDTHTHFDSSQFDHDRQHIAELAYRSGVRRLILIGVVAENFSQSVQVWQDLNQRTNCPRIELAPGLHPFFIKQHQPQHLEQLHAMLRNYPCAAIGEIGLDFYLKEHKQPEIQQDQQFYFEQQLDLAAQHQKPVLLHVRRAYAQTIQILKKHHFKYGGIAHAFGGSIQDARALIKLGFKIGITGQISNPNAKRLISVVHEIGAEHLVIETDAPDMTPLCCQHPNQRTRNTPSNLIYVLHALADTLQINADQLAVQLWQNSLKALAQSD